jgi:hypothetical protein
MRLAAVITASGCSVTGDEFERAEALLKRLAFLIGGGEPSNESARRRAGQTDAMRVGGGDINGVHPPQLSVTASLTSKGVDKSS